MHCENFPKVSQEQEVSFLGAHVEDIFIFYINLILLSSLKSVLAHAWAVQLNVSLVFVQIAFGFNWVTDSDRI